MKALSPALVASLAAFVASPLAGQDLPGQALAGGMTTTTAPIVPGGLFVADAIAHTLVPLGNVPPVLQEVATLCADPFERGRYYAGTYGPDGLGTGAVDLVEFRASGGVVTSWRVVNAQPLAEDQVIGLCVVGKDLVFLGRQSLSRVDVATGTTTTILATGLDVAVTTMACDGRYAYVAVNVRSVFRVDLYEARLPELVHVAQVGLFDLIQSIAIDGEGDLWLAVVDSPFGGGASSLRRVRASDGALINYLPLPFLGPRSVAIDAATGDVFVAGGVLSNRSSVVVVHGGVVQGAPFGATPTPLPGLAIDRGQAMHRFGHHCGANLSAAWIAANRLPDLGAGDYAVVLRRTIPSALHVMALGLHPAPGLDLAALGAPGCTFYVSPFLEQLVTADATGAVSVPLPVPPVQELRGLVFDVQFGALDPTANAFGIALSQAGAIALR